MSYYQIIINTSFSGIALFCFNKKSKSLPLTNSNTVQNLTYDNPLYNTAVYRITYELASISNTS